MAGKRGRRSPALHSLSWHCTLEALQRQHLFTPGNVDQDPVCTIHLMKGKDNTGILHRWVSVSVNGKRYRKIAWNLYFMYFTEVFSFSGKRVVNVWAVDVLGACCSMALGLY